MNYQTVIPDLNSICRKAAAQINALKRFLSRMGKNKKKIKF